MRLHPFTYVTITTNMCDDKNLPTGDGLDQFLYAHLENGHVVPWWCPALRPSVCPSEISELFSTLFSGLFDLLYSQM